MRKINDIVVPKFPVVPNSYTILGRIPSQEKWYTVLYLKDAFSPCPLDPGSRDIFAFEWEDPDMGRKQFRWMVLPQVYTESPNCRGFHKWSSGQKTHPACAVELEYKVGWLHPCPTTCFPSPGWRHWKQVKVEAQGGGT